MYWVLVVRTEVLVVGRGYVMLRWVIGAGQIVERHDAAPIVLPRPARHRRAAVAILAYHLVARHLIANVPLLVRVYEVLPRHAPLGQRRSELLPVRSRLQIVQRLDDVPRLGGGPLERERVLERGAQRGTYRLERVREQRPMLGEAYRMCDRLPALDLNRLGNDR